jgi:ribosomal protein S18 acetylase RimI-like enzyme
MREVQICARFMADSEPWITLCRDYDASIKTLSDLSKEVYVAVSGNQITGFIIINMQGAFSGYIQTICMAPDWRAKGIGRLLIDFAEKRILQDVPNVFMCVSSFNKEAQKLYQRLGYEKIGELKDYIVAGHSEILLRKTIAPLALFKKG